jgi:RNA polymerase sigma-70 factor (ECF subfamily)
METSPSLLERLRQPEAEAAWERFVDLYTPLLYYWATRRAGLTQDDAADLVQDVLTTLIQKLPDFNYQPDGSFRGWLRAVLLNTYRKRKQKRMPATAGSSLPEPPSPDTVAELGEEEYRQFLARRALQLMQAEFEPTTWQACWQTVVDGRPTAEVATVLGLTANAVYVARFRVLQRLREELQGLADF